MNDPLPTPNWDNPLPYNGYPDPADNEILAVLAGATTQLQAWVTAAVALDGKPPRERVVELAAMLTEAAEKLTEYAETLAPGGPGP